MMPFIIIVLGLLFGSFANVCIWRIPRGEEVVHTPSHCPVCGAHIRWYDNIPLASFILLSGKCRACRAPIPWRYPAIEFVSGALFLSLFLRFGMDWRLLGYIPLAWALLVVAVVDVRHYIILPAVTNAGFVAGPLFAVASVIWPRLNLSIFGFGTGWRIAPVCDSAAGFAAGWGVLSAAAWLGKRFYKQEAMGGGDITLAAMIGTFLGWKGALVAVFFASLSGSVIGIPLRLAGRLKSPREISETYFPGEAVGEGQIESRSAVPFGLFLALGAMLAILAGPALFGWYFGLFR